MAKKFILYGTLTRSVMRNFNSLCYRNRGEITILVCELSSHPHRPGTKTLSDMWRSHWKVDFHCSVIFTRVNRIETIVWKVTRKRKRTSLNLYVYAWSFIHCRFIYARTHVKKKRQWKSTFTVIVGRYPRCTCTEALSDTTFRPVECTIQQFQTDQVCSFLLLVRSTSIISR